jgi:hypothetical protein
MLKHRLKEPFGKAGLTVAICALVLALVGGAYAAGGLTKSQEKQVTKIAKKYAGKPGAAGATGPAGTPGTNGTNGTNGKNGTSVTNSVEPQGANCAEGGTKIVGTATTYACNGEEGSPWTDGGTLPSGSTETGVWTVRTTQGVSVSVPISFPIPLLISLEETQVHYVTLTQQIQGTGPEACLGNFNEPKAKAGNLCVYEYGTIHAEFSRIANFATGESGTLTTGAELRLDPHEPEPNGWGGEGTWAVTAP